MSQKRNWGSRNRWWVVAMIPAACAMLAASSFRYVTIYQPNDHTANQQVAEGKTADFSFPISLDGFDYTRSGSVEAFALQKFQPEDIPDFAPPADTDMWGVGLKWQADPSAYINGCTVWLRAADGKEYDYNSALLHSQSFDPNFRSNTACVPPKTPGPLPPSIFSPEALFNDDEPRPQEWKKVIMFVVPRGVEPKEVRIAWEPPHFLSLELPAPGMDIVSQSAIDEGRGRR